MSAIRQIAVPAPGIVSKPLAIAKPSAFQAECVRDSTGFEALEAHWRALEARCSDACLFQSFDWCRNFIEHARALKPVDIRIFVARDSKGMAAILPLAVQMETGISVLTGLAEPFQQYTNMLMRPECDPQAVFGALLPAIKASGADYLHLGQVRRDSDLYAGCNGQVPVSGEEDGAPFVAIGSHESFEAYHSTVNSKTRKNLRNAKNRLEREAPVTHVAARDGKILAEVIDRSFEGREAWLERQGLTSRAFRNSGFEAFVNRFKQPGLVGVDAIAFSLKHGDKPIADQWGFVYKGRYYAFIAGWDEAYSEASPGKLHLGNILECCHEQGIKIADFMIPAARYKFTWAKDAVIVQDHVMPLTRRGQIHNAVWLNFLRPLAKRGMYMLPQGFRSRLFRLILPNKE